MSTEGTIVGNLSAKVAEVFGRLAIDKRRLLMSR